MDNGPPPPPQGPMQHDGPMQREHDRPPSVGPKRMREWEDEPAIKKPASDETRARLNDMHHRPATPPRDPYRRNSSEARLQEQRRMEDARRAEELRRAEDMRRAEEQRHANEGYHPSEAAHHPQNHTVPPNHLPPMQSGPAPMQGILHDGPQSSPAAPKDYPPDERQQAEHPAISRPPPINEPERALRKMEVDDDYDDSGEDEKKGGIITNGSGPASTSGEMKTTTPTSAGMNGMMGQPAKVESS
jgi:hypothetical protein